VVLAGEGRRRRPVRAAALGAAYAAAVAGVNAIGLGPVDRDLSGPGLRRGGLRGMREAARRLDIDAPWVVWGHSHRSGPWPNDDESEWRTAAGGRMVNCGCWVRGRGLGSGPYAPGTAVLVEDDGPPRLLRLRPE
jgi:hypothetical protein